MIGKSIKCTSCGGSMEVPEGLNKIFCSYCGTQNLVTDVLEIPGVTLLCLKCNTNNKYENIYCDKCGARIQHKCRYCLEMHPMEKKYCPKTGLKIEEKGTTLDINMTFIPGGTFHMGDSTYYPEHSVHQVTLKSFYMGKYEVTNKEYCLFLNKLGNQKEAKVQWIQKEDNEYSGIIINNGTFEVKPGYDNRPVVYVSWHGAVAYCNWLSEQEGLEKCYGEINNRGNGDITKNGYRLSTEAEWEYACRGGSKGSYYWGDTMDDNYCWHSGNSNNNHHDVGTAGGTGYPNSFGLFDMSGNVWEWCNDWYGNYPSASAVNPSGPDSGAYKVVRGGSWKQDGENCRVSCRSSVWPGTRSHTLGFRIVRTQ